MQGKDKFREDLKRRVFGFVRDEVFGGAMTQEVMAEHIQQTLTPEEMAERLAMFEASVIFADGSPAPVSYLVSGSDDDCPFGNSRVHRVFSDRGDALNYASSLDDCTIETWQGGDCINTEDSIDVNETLAAN